MLNVDDLSPLEKEVLSGALYALGRSEFPLRAEKIYQLNGRHWTIRRKTLDVLAAKGLLAREKDRHGIVRYRRSDRAERDRAMNRIIGAVQRLRAIGITAGVFDGDGFALAISMVADNPEAFRVSMEVAFFKNENGNGGEHAV